MNYREGKLHFQRWTPLVGRPTNGVHLSRLPTKLIASDAITRELPGLECRV
jgi:hypothetical protein